MCVPGCQEAVRNALSRRGFFKGAMATSLAAAAVAPSAGIPAAIATRRCRPKLYAWQTSPMPPLPPPRSTRQSRRPPPSPSSF